MLLLGVVISTCRTLKKKLALYVSKKVYNECSVAEFGAGTDENKLNFDEW